MKDQFRAIFAGGLKAKDAVELLDRWIARAVRSRFASFVKVARTVRRRRATIVNALEQGISNGQFEGMNTKVRLGSMFACDTLDFADFLVTRQSWI